MIKIKNACESAEEDDGFRILVEPSWPRGLSEEKAELDLWLKEISPPIELCRWFNQDSNGSRDSERWSEFQRRYLEELKNKPTLISIIRDAEKKNGTVTLLYASEDEERNIAVVLRDKLMAYKVISNSVTRIHGA